MGLDRHVAPELRVISEPHAFGVDQRGAFVEHLLAAAALPFELEMGKLGAAVDPGGLVGVGLDHHGIATLRGGDIDDVGKVIFPGCVVVSDLAEPAEQIAGAHRHHARVAQTNGPLFLARILILDHPGDMVALARG